MWKVVSALSARWLDHFSDTIIDVSGDDEDDDNDVEDEGPGPRSETRKDQ